MWSKDHNEYEPSKQMMFNNIKDAIECKDISSDLIDNVAYEIYIDDKLVESGRYEDLKNSIVKGLYQFCKRN